MSRLERILATGAAGFVLSWATPAGAEPSFVKAFENLRPIEGRPAELLVSGRVHDALFLGFEGASIEGEGENAVLVVQIHTERLDLLNIDDRFAFPVEIPPLAGGQHELIVRRREGEATTTTEETRSVFLVHPPIAVELVEDAQPGFFRVNVKGRSSGADFNGAPALADGKITAPIQLGCYLECLADPPIVVDWDITSERIGPLEPGSYQLELAEDPVPAGRARLAWRGEVEVASDPVLLRGGAFEIEVELAPPYAEIPRLAMPVSQDSALFYFFSEDNWELMVKVLDGCAINGHFWVYAAASTDVGYTLRVRDHLGYGLGSREYVFPGGAPAPALTDSEALPCTCPVCSGL